MATTPENVERDDDPAPGADDRRGSRLGYRAAFTITAIVLLGIVVTLPFSLAGVVDDLLGPPTGDVISITTGSHASAAPTHSRVHLAFVAINEVELMAKMRISGHYVCRKDCDTSHRIILVSITPDDADAEGLPPSVKFILPPDGEAFSQTFELPIRGHPIHYPFDRYQMLLAVALQRVHPDGTVEALSPEQASGQLFLTVQELLPRQRMSLPLTIAPRVFERKATRYHTSTPSVSRSNGRCTSAPWPCCSSC